MVVQLDETEFPSKLRRTQKLRTEIDTGTEFPNFFKNMFDFSKVCLGSRLVLRFGLYSTTCNNSFAGTSAELFAQSKLIGAADFLFTTSVIDLVRKHKFVHNEVYLLHPEVSNKETGKVSFKVSLKSQTLETKFCDDNQEVESCYYDPFETDPDTIKDVSLSVLLVFVETKKSCDLQ